MKKLFCICALAALSFHWANAQTISEPDFIGEVLVVKNNEDAQLLQKQISKIQTRANASMYIVGIGAVKSKLVVDGISSTSVIDVNDDFYFIVRATDNDSDPMSIIRIFEFTPFKSSNTRKAELSSTGTFSGSETNKNNYLPFTAKKYGEHSYLIKLEKPRKGEFGITVSNPNAIDEKQTIVSTFSLVDKREKSLSEQLEESRREAAEKREAEKAARKAKRKAE